MFFFFFFLTANVKKTFVTQLNTAAARNAYNYKVYTMSKDTFKSVNTLPATKLNMVFFDRTVSL